MDYGKGLNMDNNLKHNSNMAVFERLINNQGTSFILLVIFTYYFYNEVQNLKAENTILREQIYQLYNQIINGHN